MVAVLWLCFRLGVSEVCVWVCVCVEEVRSGFIAIARDEECRGEFGAEVRRRLRESPRGCRNASRKGPMSPSDLYLSFT